MKKLISIGLATIVLAGLSGCAQDGMMRHGPMKEGMGMKGGMSMKSMDTNNDEMISKEEFMKHHESMYDKMKKGSNGMVGMKDMQMMMDDSMMKKY